MKKGFTLVEMLVILVFLSVIALMAVPSITNMIKKGTDDKYKLFLDDVYLATEAYLQKHADDYPSLNVVDAKTYIYMKDLVDEGFISTNLVNPKYCVDNECISKKIATCTNKTCSVDDYTIIVTKDEDGKYKYELKNEIIEECANYSINQVVFDKGYTGSVETFTPLCNGKYKIELWGAQGGDISTYSGGKGAYASGNISLDKNNNLYLYVGGAGSNTDIGGYNGGGSLLEGQKLFGSSGGGATDVRYFSNTPSASDLVWNSQLGLNSRIMVAGAGGGANHRSEGYGDGNGGSGGGLNGEAGQSINHTNGYGYILNTGATQISGGTSPWVNGTEIGNTSGGLGLFGKAATPSVSNNAHVQSGAGGGYYAGGAGNHCGGSGGSSYISGHTGSVAIASNSTSEPRAVKTSGCTTGTSNNECSIHYSGLKFTNTNMIDGKGHTWTNIDTGINNNNLMPNPSGGYYASGAGNIGNGHAKITYLGE